MTPSIDIGNHSCLTTLFAKIPTATSSREKSQHEPREEAFRGHLTEIKNKKQSNIENRLTVESYGASKRPQNMKDRQSPISNSEAYKCWSSK